MVVKITNNKYSYQKTSDFFEQEEDFDVLFFGTSHAINGIFPMDLWNDYGIVSYNLANHGECFPVTYYNMLMALNETTPKVVVIDVHFIYSKQRYSGSIGQVHKSLDTYPVSKVKYDAIKDIFEGEDIFQREIEFLFPFTMYHSRWEEIEENDFKVESLYEKGAESRINVAQPNTTSDFDSVEIYDDEENVNMEYLKKIIEYCKENNIDILLIDIPYPATDEQIACSKYAQLIADEYDVNYINFLSMDIVNYNIDCYDEYSHLNPSGARKVTDYIGKYIMQNYNISDQRDNEAYSFWYEDYDEYIDLKIKNLKNNRENLNNYLMLLYDEKDIEYEIKVQSTLKIEEDSTLYYLLENLDNNYEIDDVAFMELNEKTGEYELKEKTIKITTWDKRTDKQLDEVWF